VSKHVFHFIDRKLVFVYLDRWRRGDGVLRASVGCDKGHMENRVYALYLGKS